MSEATGAEKFVGLTMVVIGVALGATGVRSALQAVDVARSVYQLSEAGDEVHATAARSRVEELEQAYQQRFVDAGVWVSLGAVAARRRRSREDY